MADRSISLPVTPDSTDSRRSSTGKLTSSKDEEKIVPNYLRASTGSCHDFCKYGKKHAAEEKERRPFPRRAIKKPTDSNQHSPEIQIQVFSKPRSKKNTEGLLLSKSADSNNDVLKAAISTARKASVPERLRQSADSKLSRFHESKTSPAERLTGSLDGKLSGFIETSSQMGRTSSRERKTTAQPTDLRTLTDPETNLASKTLKKGMPSSSLAKLKNPSNQASPRAKGLALSEKLGSSFKPKLSSSPNNNAAGLSAQRKSDIGTGQKSSALPKVALRKLQVSPKPLVSPRLSGAGLSARRQSDMGSGQKSSLLPKIALRKLQVSPKPMSSPRLAVSARALASPRVSLSPRSSLAGVAGLNAKRNRAAKVLSAMKNDQPKKEDKIRKAASNLQPKIQDKSKKQVTSKQRTIKKVKEEGDDKVEEKTLYVIKMETEDKHMESDLNERLDGDTSPLPVSSPRQLSLPGCSSASSRTNNEEEEEGSEYSLTDGEDESSYEYDDETESMGIEEQNKWNRRKAMVSCSGDIDPQPVKLRFRRGKVIEIKSENDGPRRLKFRRSRVLSEGKNPKADGRVRYQSRGEGDVVDAKKSEEKVVLRHQEVDGKKDAGQGGLFNNVIEETASKLAETRKSKVKALVGAFETVISLQDVKPSGNVVVS
ncbi:unnamed protein product [Linum tenue]|uniref:Calmodulin-binding domain-containing protein n=1 Tax=Linum tenue TaxID=586396 RepID=A0AAV0N6T0_9ROSI|nr:unnamed protein product [Linum tenue]